MQESICPVFWTASCIFIHFAKTSYISLFCRMFGPIVIFAVWIMMWFWLLEMPPPTWGGWRQYVFGSLSFHPSLCMYKSHKLITPECLKRIHLNWLEIITKIFQWTDYILGYIGQKLKPPQKKIRAKIKLCSHNSIQMNQFANFVNRKDLQGQC